MNTTLNRSSNGNITSRASGLTRSRLTHRASTGTAWRAGSRLAPSTRPTTKDWAPRTAQRGTSILHPGVAAEIAAENLWNKVLLGTLAVASGMMALTCYWNLQALVLKWGGFVKAWAAVLQG